MSSVTVCALLTMAQLPGQVTAPSPPRATDADRGEETVRLAQNEAGRYDIVRQDGRGTLLELRDRPILKWSNANNGTLYGSVVLWTVDGRPEALASFYRWYVDQQKFHAEFKSLSTEPLQATRGGEVAWEPSKPDLEFRTLKDKAQPADGASARLRQMRDIARRFSGKVVPPTESATSLRLLTQPLYRYEKTPPDVIDGALFAFVQGTDPEILLLIEAVREEKRTVWKYAVARLNMFELHLALDDEEVWSAKRITWKEVIDLHGAYSVLVLDY